MHPQRVNIPLQILDRCALTVGAMSGSLEFSNGISSPVVDLTTWQAIKKHRGEANMKLTLASGGSEHAWLFSIVISWGSKMISVCMQTWLIFAQIITISYTM